MSFQIVRNDITKIKADAIVNTANPNPVIGSGTDSAIYKAAGENRLLAERMKIGRIVPGEAAYTDAFDLDAKYIIHTVGPAWNGGDHEEVDILRSCYKSSLAIADKLKCRSIAFPLIATGVYGFPKDLALETAMEVIGKFLLTHEMKVIIVVFDRKSFELSSSIVNDIEQLVSDHDVDSAYYREYRTGPNIRRHYREELANITYELEEDLLEYKDLKSNSITPESFPDVSGKTLDEVLDSAGDSFKKRLFELIDSSGMDDVTVYKKANIDRKVFSSIKCKKEYKPKKKTAIAFAIALELDMPTMIDLLARAEIAFSPSNKFDLIIAYFVTNKKYDIYEINAVLFKYGQPLLGY